MLRGMERESTKAPVRLASRLWGRLSAELFPPTCLFCDAVQTQNGCCPACLAAIRILDRHRCLGCGRPLAEALVPGPCGRCLQSPPLQCETHSLYSYRGPVRRALLDWKLAGRDAGVRWLTAAAGSRLRELIAPNDLLLPIPMPLSRMRKRGLHHAADLASLLAAATGASREWQLLRREGEQPRQSQLSAGERLRNLRHAFALAPEAKQVLSAFDGRIWLVDDIITTGATMKHAAKPLVRAGFAVRALSLARTSFSP